MEGTNTKTTNGGESTSNGDASKTKTGPRKGKQWFAAPKGASRAQQVSTVANYDATSVMLPYLGAGVLAIVAGAIRKKDWPDNTLKSTLATVALMLIAGVASQTKLAPLVKAIGMLLFFAAGMAAVRAGYEAKKRKPTSGGK